MFSSSVDSISTLSSESPDSFESAEAELAADGISDNQKSDSDNGDLPPQAEIVTLRRLSFDRKHSPINMIHRLPASQLSTSLEVKVEENCFPECNKVAKLGDPASFPPVSYKEYQESTVTSTVNGMENTGYRGDDLLSLQADKETACALVITLKRRVEILNAEKQLLIQQRDEARCDREKFRSHANALKADIQTPAVASTHFKAADDNVRACEF